MAGAYTSTYNSVSPGITEDGFTLQQEVKYEVIEQSDLYAKTLLDLIYQGGQTQMMFDCLAYKAGSTSPFWPWGALGVITTTAAPIGRLGTAVGVAFVLTAVANTPAAAAPATLTAAAAILAPNVTGTLLYSSRLRKVPVKLQFLPSLSTGTLTTHILT